MLAHSVYFSLRESSDAGRQKLLASCSKYLVDHPGVVFFATGTLATELNRPVNDRNFDVALHIVFATQADHDRYQVAPAHLKFVAENKETWKQVRVFDSLVEKA
jgi:hypothetical protein